MKTKTLGKLMSVLFAVYFLFASIYHLPIHAAADQKTIRVAYPIQNRITDIDEQGNYSGYTYEYLQEIAQYTGWNYEFVQVKGTVDEQITKLMNMVQNGEVDLMGAMLYNEQLSTMFDYSSYSYGTVETVLRSSIGKEKNIVIDASRSQTMRIGALSDTGRQVDDLQEFCEMNLIVPEIIVYQNEEAILKALENEEIDVMLDSSFNLEEDLRIIARFSPKQFYFVTPPNHDSTILQELNEAMLNLHQTDPYFQTTLYDKYFAPQIYHLAFTQNETDYIAGHRELKAGVLANQPPFQYKKGNQLTGIGIEVLHHIADQTSLSFALIEADSQQQLYEYLEDGTIDIIVGMPYDYVTAANHNISMTRPYVNSQYIMLMNDHISDTDMSNKTLAVLKHHPSFETASDIIEYDSIEDCIRAVDKGIADYTYVDMYIAQYYINLPEYSNVKMATQNNTASLTSFGISATADRSLYNILNKAILSIPEDEMQSIINLNNTQPEYFSISMFIKKNPMQSILILISGFSILLILLLIILHQRNHAAKLSNLQLNRHMRLYALTNDLIFEYDYKKQDFMLSIPETTIDKQKIIHYDFSKPVDDMQDAKSRDVVLNILNAKENGIFEAQLKSTDGKWYWFKVIIEIISGDSSEPVYAIGRLNLIDAERKERAALIEKAHKDSLTQLYNVESSKRKIQTCLKDAKENRGALLILDIDEFKTINDTYGHLFGDHILQSVAKFLQSHFSKDDIIGRPGGDEFLVYMPNIKNTEDLDKKCASICEGIHEIKINSKAHITISIGAALAMGTTDYEALYQVADKALYKTKNTGRNGYHIEYFKPPM